MFISQLESSKTSQPGNEISGYIHIELK